MNCSYNHHGFDQILKYMKFRHEIEPPMTIHDHPAYGNPLKTLSFWLSPSESEWIPGVSPDVAQAVGFPRESRTGCDNNREWGAINDSE